MTDAQKLEFRLRLKQVCQEFNAPEMVALVDIEGRQTAVIQISNTRFENPFYNNFAEQLSMMVTECGKVETII